MTRPRSGERAVPESGPGGADAAEPAWRLFIAVPVPEPIRTEVDRRLAPLRATVPARWQSPETWHLTLQFLGQVPVDGVGEIEAAVRDVARGSRAFRAELRGTGSFERRGAGAVAWIGMGAGGPEVAALAESLRRVLRLPRDHEGPFRPHLTLAREAPDGIAASIQAAIDRPVPPDRLRAPGSGHGMSGAPVRHGAVGLGGGLAAAGPGDVARGAAAAAPGTRDVGSDMPPDPATLTWTADRIVLYRSILGRGPAQHLPIVTALLGTGADAAVAAPGGPR